MRLGFRAKLVAIAVLVSGLFGFIVGTPTTATAAPPRVAENRNVVTASQLQDGVLRLDLKICEQTNRRLLLKARMNTVLSLTTASANSAEALTSR